MATSTQAKPPETPKPQNKFTDTDEEEKKGESEAVKQLRQQILDDPSLSDQEKLEALKVLNQEAVQQQVDDLASKGQPLPAIQQRLVQPVILQLRTTAAEEASRERLRTLAEETQLRFRDAWVNRVIRPLENTLITATDPELIAQLEATLESLYKTEAYNAAFKRFTDFVREQEVSLFGVGANPSQVAEFAMSVSTQGAASYLLQNLPTIMASVRKGWDKMAATMQAKILADPQSAIMELHLLALQEVKMKRDAARQQLAALKAQFAPFEQGKAADLDALAGQGAKFTAGGAAGDMPLPGGQLREAAAAARARIEAMIQGGATPEEVQQAMQLAVSELGNLEQSLRSSVVATVTAQAGQAAQTTAAQAQGALGAAQALAKGEQDAAELQRIAAERIADLENRIRNAGAFGFGEAEIKQIREYINNIRVKLPELIAFIKDPAKNRTGEPAQALFDRTFPVNQPADTRPAASPSQIRAPLVSPVALKLAPMTQAGRDVFAGITKDISEGRLQGAVTEDDFARLVNAFRNRGFGESAALVRAHSAISVGGGTTAQLAEKVERGEDVALDISGPPPEEVAKQQTAMAQARAKALGIPTEPRPPVVRRVQRRQ